MSISVGFIGLGNMGEPMASNIRKNGFEMTVFDINKRVMEPLVRAGAAAAASGPAVVERSERRPHFAPRLT